jgi:pSer/pThr/pTyr-binding forkhead associated (FHA) protein
MTMVLVPLDGGRPIPLDKAVLFFGRSPDCDVVLKNSRKVSRKHCCVAQIDDRYLVRDLGSMNGVRVNDRLIKSEAPLTPGDELWVGDLGYLFQPHEQNQPRAAGNKRQPRTSPPSVDPDLLSQDVPVAIPEEGHDFAVEESQPRKKIRKDELLELDEDDLLPD